MRRGHLYDLVGLDHVRDAALKHDHAVGAADIDGHIGKRMRELLAERAEIAFDGDVDGLGTILIVPDDELGRAGLFGGQKDVARPDGNERYQVGLCRR